ncbi:hypothetical protein [Vulcanococcus limneticus]|uniref:hypothetical protein n=1 Tax=Vulcanococcus limneticus TaxID=2170428 RepID=UPI0020CD32F7|nr:hypothetical protein [Vulcanococcus limneticus]MCP9791231.1 hypothetical protein [Vulcanococcus limneticus MW73D5]MCP9893553.1 hypothetical protein [Vulcanococcus limneticus Candia 3F8]MCP9896629.1 hypothetical protein [Vulcanococcus limneticus Candia 3B3]
MVPLIQVVLAGKRVEQQADEGLLYRQALFVNPEGGPAMSPVWRRSMNSFRVVTLSFQDSPLGIASWLPPPPRRSQFTTDARLLTAEPFSRRWSAGQPGWLHRPESGAID